MVFLNLRELSSCDTYHPHELCYVVATEVGLPAEDNEDIVGAHEASHIVPALFSHSKGLANRGDVRIVPRVVVDQHCSIGHARDLVTIVPPRQDASILRCVLL